MTRPAVALLLAALSAPSLAGPAYSEIGATAGAEAITNNTAAWRHQDLTWQRRNGDDSAYYVTAAHDERFDLNDSQIGGGLHMPVSRRWAFDARIDFSPQHNFLPRDSLLGGVDFTVRRGLIIHASMRHSRYRESQANVAALGVEAYVSAWRLAYTLYEGTSAGASGASHLVEADWYYGNVSFVGLALVHGREVERISATHLVVAPINGFTLKGKHALSAHWAITYTLGLSSLQGFYTRRGVSVGVVYRY